MAAGVFGPGTIVFILTALLALVAGCRNDEVFMTTATGVVDRRTSLEWTPRDHERSLNWDDANRYCRELRPGNGAEWRLPEVGELQSLYDVRLDEPCGDRRCHLDPALRLGGPYVWSATPRGVGARFYFDFAYGNSFSPGTAPTLVRRVLCVRTYRRL